MRLDEKRTRVLRLLFAVAALMTWRVVAELVLVLYTLLIGGAVTGTARWSGVLRRGDGRRRELRLCAV